MSVVELLARHGLTAADIDCLRAVLSLVDKGPPFPGSGSPYARRRHVLGAIASCLETARDDAPGFATRAAAEAFRDARNLLAEVLR